MSENGLDLLTSLVEAAYAREKFGPLDRAGRKVNVENLEEWSGGWMAAGTPDAPNQSNSNQWRGRVFRGSVGES